MNDSFLNISNIKKILTLLLTFLVIVIATIFITGEIVKLQPDSVQQSIAEQFNKIKVQLEFKGLTKSVKEMTEEYSEEFDGFSNIIITNDTGNILFKVNNGYIFDQNKFSVLIDPWEENGLESQLAYLIDENNSIKYVAQIETSHNSNKLKEESSKNSLSNTLFSKNENDDLNMNNKEVKNSDGTSYIISNETKTIMSYEYIASKGLNLYSLYDSEHQYNNYYTITNLLTIFRRWLTIAAVIFLILFWILLPLWVYKDAIRRTGKFKKWVIVTSIFNIIGVALYLIFRPKISSSEQTGSETNTMICPHCNQKIEI